MLADLVIPAHATITLSPFGDDVVLTDPAPLHAGQIVPLTLTFRNGGTITVQAAVTQPGTPCPLHDGTGRVGRLRPEAIAINDTDRGQRRPLRAVATHIAAGDVIAGVLHGDKAAMITRLRGGGPAVAMAGGPVAA